MSSLERWLIALCFVLLPSCGGAPASTTAPAHQEEKASPAQPAAPAAGSASPAGPAAPVNVRLYALDCGRAAVRDMKTFGDVGGPKELVAACYLIQHPRGTLLWDTGISDTVAQTKGGVELLNGALRFSVETTLRDHLSALHLTPADVQYVAFSHLHIDHAGNANLFPTATWILNRREYDWATATPPPANIEPTLFSAYRTAKLRLLDGEADVFGDGALKIVPTPGHTPGHQSLVVHLQRAGTIIISGDVCHTHGNCEHHRMPPFNTDRDESIRSIDRIRALAESTHARLVVQHEPDELAKFPRFPAFLD